MSLSESVLRAQVRRLSGLAYRPDDDVGWREIGRALRAVAHDEATAVAVVDAWLQTHQTFPTPADMVACAAEVCERRLSSSVPSGCQSCAGSGRVHVEIRGLSAMSFCSCERGRWLAEKDRERREVKV